MQLARPLNSKRSRSRGITLTEVLVAIFIMGIGLLALLSLFPLGALTMAQAIKDDRESQLQDVAVSLEFESGRIQNSVDLVRTLYESWLSQGGADPKQVAVAVVILESHATGLASLEDDVRSRLPNLNQSDRKLAREILRLLRDGRRVIHALQRNLRVIQNLQRAGTLSGKVAE
jgi:prepilin-type N-terminal cleavage/methylation domain-containing protein